MTLSQSLLSEVNRRLGEREKLLVAFSGGLDSSVLLHILVQLRETVRPRLSIRARYIHHGLSPNAEAWSQHCQQCCATWQVDFKTGYVVLDTSQMGIEAAARQARYAFFSDELQPGESLLTAHHLDDQCETFLLALKRGSGPAGLASMPDSMPFAQGEILRLLIGTPRKMLESYAKEQRLQWVEDESNQDAVFDRNFLRLKVLPMIGARWPHFAEATARSASLCGEQEQLLDELLAEQLTSLLDKQRAIYIKGLMPCSVVKRNALLRRWLALFSVPMPARTQMERIWHEVALSREDAEPVLKLGNYQVRRYREHLYLLPLFRPLQDVILPWTGEGVLELPDGLGILSCNSTGISVRAPLEAQNVTVRFGAKGRVRLVGQSGSRPLKKIWQASQIPPWQRERVPLLYYDETLIAAVGVFVTEAGQNGEGQKEWRIEWSGAAHLSKPILQER